MNDDDRDPLAALRSLPADDRRAFCDRVMRNLSEIVEGTEDEALRDEVQTLLGRCRPYLAVRDTLETTIRELARLGREPPEIVEDPEVSACVEEVRKRLREE